MRPDPPPDGSGLFGHIPHYFQPEILVLLCGGGLVDPALEHSAHRDVGQRVVRFAFFSKGFDQCMGIIVELEAFRKCSRHSVSGDLIVLDAVERGDEDGVADAARRSVVHPPFGFADQAAHRFALFSAGVEPVLEKELLKPCALLLALTKLAVESLAQLVVGGTAGQFGERGDKLGFGTEKVAKLVVVELFEICCHGFRGVDG